MTTVAGCDLSTFQAEPDYDQLTQQVRFVFIKATEGVGYTDDQFRRSWSEAARVGLIRGGYHFARPDLGNDPITEADWFVRVVKPAAGDLLALDYEVDYHDPVGWCTAFLDRVTALTGTRPYLYLNLSTVRGYDWTPALGYPLWLADYDGSPDFAPNVSWPAVAIKQWTSGGALAGVRGNVDLNTFFGTAEQLAPTPALEDDMADPQVIALLTRIADTLDALAKVSLPTWLDRIGDGRDVASGGADKTATKP